MRPSFASMPLSNRGRRECRMPAAPAASRAKVESTRDSHHRYTGSEPGIPCTMVLTAYFVLSPVTGLFCHRRSAKKIPRNLTPASGRQDHTPSPSALAPLVSAPPPRPPHPAPNVRDDRDTSPLSGRDVAG